MIKQLYFSLSVTNTQERRMMIVIVYKLDSHHISDYRMRYCHCCMVCIDDKSLNAPQYKLLQ
jgi:hypothetical protein